MEIIQEIGSYAGLAAIVGLAVLSALYFSQARDVRRLRDWAGRAPERTGPLAQPTQGLARPVPRPVPRPPGVQSTQPGLRPAAAPAPGTAAASAAGAAPAASNGPAAATPAAARAAAGDEEEGDPAEGVSEDTMSHPPPSRLDEDAGEYGPELEDEEPERDATGDSPGHAEDFEDEDEDEYEGEYEDEDDWDDDYDEETGDRPAVMPPLPAAGGPARPVPPPPRTTTLPPRAAPVTVAGARPATASSPRPAMTSGSGSTILPPYERSRPDGDPWHRRFFYSRGRAALVSGLGVLVLAAATLGGLKLAGGEDEPGAPAAEQVGGAGQGTGPGGRGGGGAGDGGDDPQPAIDPSQVTVAVLNGTTVTGLAADVGDTVENAGYQLGNVTNSLDQERAESVVFYAPGAEVEAEDVGRRLKIAQREQIDPDTQGLAGDASVVVVVGADRM